ncbi:MAG: MBL fold metallo-hydrolase [Chloroflexi bacterium]|nr:MBL fold metallo-hydrolase [Chloroflexota bacterium]
MLIKQVVDENLGNSSYLVASEQTRQAVVIDAERDIDRYVRIAEGLGLHLTHALDTHLHADFVSGARELAAQYAVTIGASADSNLAFDYLRLKEGDALSLGDVKLGVLATPGHTPEHISFALIEEKRTEPTALFTGGALIVGGAARTDLLGHHITRPLTRLSYKTIHEKLLRYPDDVAVYPTHGAGSFCNALSSPDRASTIGRERQANPLTRATSEEEFIAQALGNLPSYPIYFNYLRAVNQLGTKVLDGIPILEPLSPRQVREHMAQGSIVVDTRTPREFASGHIPNSFGISLASPLSTWAGWVLPFRAPIILIGDDSTAREDAVRQLIRIGYDDLRGYLDGGIAAWQAEALTVTRVPVISVEEFHSAYARGNALRALDVRQDAEWRAGHLPRAIHIEGGRLPFGDLPIAKDEPLVIHCGHSDRSAVAISVLERRGYRDLRLLYGGFSAWSSAGYPVVRGDA